MVKYQKTLLLTISFFYFSLLLLFLKSATLPSWSYLLLFLWWAGGSGATLFYLAIYSKNLTHHLVQKWRREQKEPDLEEYKAQIKQYTRKIRHLVDEVNQKNTTEQALYKKLHHLKDMNQNQEDEYHFLNQDLQSQLEKKERALSESRQMLKEQREIIEGKQSEINVLNMKVNDLKYEIENLLNVGSKQEEFFKEDISPKPAEPSLKKPLSTYSLGDKLAHYIQMAQKMTETNPFASPKKGQFFPFGTLLIDQRRFFDHLESEDADVVLVYSKEEERLLFVNKQIQNLLGWSPEKMLRDFPFIVQKGLSSWQEALQNSVDHQLHEVRMLMKTNLGQNILTHCYLQKVPQGAFEGHVLGILSSAAKRL